MFAKIRLWPRLLDILFPTRNDVALVLPRLNTLPSADSSDLPKNFFSLFAYKHEDTRKLVWSIKYYRNIEAAKLVGKLLAEKILSETNSVEKYEKYLIFAVPQTNRRFKERGFDHTALLAEQTLNFLEQKRPDAFARVGELVIKTRHTQKQSSLENRSERLKNLAGAFVVSDPATVQRKNIVILDDVITTGATVGEISRELLLAGAASVRAFSIAH